MSMWNKLIIAGVCLISFSCKQKETPSLATQADPIKKFIGIWATPETAPYFKVLSLYNDNTFWVIVHSDVGGYKYRGKYRLDDMSIALFPEAYDPTYFMPPWLPESEQFQFHKGDGKIQWIKSSSEDRFKMYLCDGLDDREEWLEFIINSEDFKNRVKRYRYTQK